MMAAPESARPEDGVAFDPEDWMSEEGYWQEMKERDEEILPPCYRCGAELAEHPDDVIAAAKYLCAEIHNRAKPETIERAAGFLEAAIGRAEHHKEGT